MAAGALIVTTLAAHAASAQSPPAAPAAVQTPATVQNAAVTAPAVDIHDIRGPKPISSPWLISLVALTSLSAVGGAYAAWVWNRRRFREASQRPLDIALARLDNARLLMLPPHGREFSIEVSSAVRDYIESRFDLRAAHLTTHEFLHQVLEPVDSLLAAHRSRLEHFLQTCDLAKFGGWNLAATDMDVMLQSARRFVVESAVEVGSRGMQAPATRAPATRPARAAATGAAAVRPTATPSVATVPVDQPPTSASRETYVSLRSA